jgi:thiamine biosynthesis lipoprotein
VSVDRPSLPTREREPANVHRFSHQAMATVFEVHVSQADGRYAAQAAHAAFDVVDRLERDLSRFLPNSDVGRINHLGAGEQARVSPSTMECLVIARHAFDLTDGAFDISMGTGLRSLELDPDHLTVRAAGDGVRIDLGGIGKGYAVDGMADVLEEWGLERALVHGGFSSMLALAPPADRDGWPLTLSDPARPSRVLTTLSAQQLALGASGVGKGDHVVDPRTGQAAQGRRAAWVAVDRPRRADVRRLAGAQGEPAFRLSAAAVSDALSTAFMLMRVQQIETLCDRNPGLQAWCLEDTAADPAEGTPVRHFGTSTGRGPR